MVTPLGYLSSWLANRLCDPAHGFGPASLHEPTVFGARRPGFPFPTVSGTTVDAWIAFMQSQQIKRVVCLLPQKSLRSYRHLLETYNLHFGTPNACWSPIDDFKLADARSLTQVILPFLADADQHQERVVIHCSGGIGRTGHVLAAWLVGFRGMSNEEAIGAVRQMGRNPREARDPGLDRLLDNCRNTFVP